MRIGFVTCVQLGLHCLETVAANGGRFELVVTLPDDSARAKSGRVDVDDFCARTGTDLFKVRNINDEASLERLRAARLDWLLIIGWSQIARAPLLSVARLGTIGMHPTLLPRGRGRASIPWAILKGLDETGVTLFKLDEGVDSGPIAAQRRVPVAADETATSLYSKISQAHGELLLEAWPALLRGDLRFMPQDETHSSVWPGRKPEDGALAVSMSVAEAERLVRAVTHPYPGAFLDTGEGRLRVWRARVAQRGAVAPGFDAGRAVIGFADGALQLEEWQIEGQVRSL